MNLTLFLNVAKISYRKLKNCMILRHMIMVLNYIYIFHLQMGALGIDVVLISRSIDKLKKVAEELGRNTKQKFCTF